MTIGQMLEIAVRSRFPPTGFAGYRQYLARLFKKHARSLPKVAPIAVRMLRDTDYEGPELIPIFRTWDQRIEPVIGELKLRKATAETWQDVEYQLQYDLMEFLGNLQSHRTQLSTKEYDDAIEFVDNVIYDFGLAIYDRFNLTGY